MHAPQDAYAVAIESAFEALLSEVDAVVDSIRYYYFDSERRELHGIFSFRRHHRLSLVPGQLVRAYSSSFEGSIPFLCVDKKCPVYMIVDNRFPPEREQLSAIEVIRTPVDPCPQLAGPLHHRWCDIPLLPHGIGVTSDAPIGKLSCSIRETASDEEVYNAIWRLLEVASKHAIFIEHQYLRRLFVPFAAIESVLCRQNSIAAVLEATVEEVERRIDGVEAAAYIISIDSVGLMRASLTASTCLSAPDTIMGTTPISSPRSYDELVLYAAWKQQIVTFHVDRGDPTIFVGDDLARCNSDFVVMHGSHGMSLLFPVIVEGASRAVVICRRMDQEECTDSFAEVDVLLLQRVCNELLPSRMAGLRHQVTADAINAWLATPFATPHFANGLADTLRWGYREFLTGVTSLFKAVLPEPEDGKYLYVLTLWESGSDDTICVPHIVAGQLAEDEKASRCAFPLRGSIQEIIERNQGFVSLCDVTRAAETVQLDMMHPDAKCAVGVGIVRGGQIIGSILLISAKYDLHPWLLEPRLTFVSRQVGALLACRGTIACSMAGLRYDCGVLLRQILKTPNLPAVARQEAMLAESVLKSVCKVSKLQPRLDPTTCSIVDITQEVEGIAEMLSGARFVVRSTATGKHALIEKDLFRVIIFKMCMSAAHLTHSAVIIDISISAGFVCAFLRFAAEKSTIAQLCRVLNTGLADEVAYVRSAFESEFVIGFQFVQALAQCHSFSDGRNGSLVVVDDSAIDVRNPECGEIILSLSLPTAREIV